MPHYRFDTMIISFYSKNKGKLVKIFVPGLIVMLLLLSWKDAACLDEPYKKKIQVVSKEDDKKNENINSQPSDSKSDQDKDVSSSQRSKEEDKASDENPDLKINYEDIMKGINSQNSVQIVFACEKLKIAMRESKVDQEKLQLLLKELYKKIKDSDESVRKAIIGVAGVKPENPVCLDILRYALNYDQSKENQSLAFDNLDIDKIKVEVYLGLLGEESARNLRIREKVLRVLLNYLISIETRLAQLVDGGGNKNIINEYNLARENAIILLNDSQINHGILLPLYVSFISISKKRLNQDAKQDSNDKNKKDDDRKNLSDIELQIDIGHNIVSKRIISLLIEKASKDKYSYDMILEVLKNNNTDDVHFAFFIEEAIYYSVMAPSTRILILITAIASSVVWKNPSISLISFLLFEVSFIILLIFLIAYILKKGYIVRFLGIFSNGFLSQLTAEIKKELKAEPNDQRLGDRKIEN